MNILMMTNTYLPQVGGVAGSVARFTEALKELGHEVLIVAPSYEDQPEEEAGVVRLPAVQKFNGSDFSVILPIPGLLDQALSSFSPDIVHAHHPFLLGGTAVRVSRRYEIPLVYTYHTQYEHYTHYVPVDLPRMREFVIHLSTGYAEMADAVIAPSQSIADLLKQREVTSQIEVVPTGIFPESFQAGQGKRMRHQLGLPETASVVGHVGRLAPEKNLGFLADSLTRVLKKQPHAQCLVVGHGPSQEEIQQQFDDRGLGDHLHMPGCLTGRDLVDAYHAMDLFVFASKTETQGMVLTEAMAAGVPVVALNAPGVREVVMDQENGLLVEHEDVKVFADAVATALSWTPRQTQARKQQARDTATRFAMPRCAAQLLDVYQGTIHRFAEAQGPYDEMLWQRAIEQIKTEWQLWSNVAGAIGEALYADESDKPDGGAG
jgi:glycosyltransferase involved in cell wall biosynthesis